MTRTKTGTKKIYFSFPALLPIALFFIFLLIGMPIPIHYITNFFLPVENISGLLNNLTWYVSTRYGMHLVINRIIIDTILATILYFIVILHPSVQKLVQQKLSSQKVLTEVALGVAIVLLLMLIWSLLYDSGITCADVCTQSIRFWSK